MIEKENNQESVNLDKIFEEVKEYNFFEKDELKKTGIDILLNNSVSHERLPMLEVVNDRLARYLVRSFRNFTKDNTDITLSSLTSTRLIDFLESVDFPSMICVFKALEWDNSGLIVFGKDISYSMIDILMGGVKGSMPNTEMNERLFTTIEQSIIKKLCQIILTDLAHAFKPIANINFEFERIETNPKLSMILRPSSSVVCTKLKINMSERGGFIDIILPYATIEPIRNILIQKYMGEKFGKDSIWESHLQNELLETDIEVQAHLNDDLFPLKEVLNWEVGSHIFLSCNEQSSVNLFCGTKKLFIGEMGQKTGRLCIKILETCLTNNGGEVEYI